jgi:hypothetical protein
LIRKITFARERGLVFKFHHVAQNPERTSPDRPFPDRAMSAADLAALVAWLTKR